MPSMREPEHISSLGRLDIPGRLGFGPATADSVQAAMADFMAEGEQRTRQWEQENRETFATLRADVQAAGFGEALDRLHHDLIEVPFNRSKLEQRTVSWIPDNSADTLATGGERLRAIHGHVLLLTSRPEGIRGDPYALQTEERQENAQSLFYMLGLAVEDANNQLTFQQLISPDVGAPYPPTGDYSHLYGVLGGRVSAMASHFRNEAIQDLKKQPHPRLYDIDPASGQLDVEKKLRSFWLSKIDAAYAEPERPSLTAEEITQHYDQIIANLGSVPLLEEHPQVTSYLTETLLAKPPRQPGWWIRQLVAMDLKSTEQPKAKAWYSERLEGLVPDNSLNNQLILRDRLAEYLRTDPVFEAILQNKQLER